jgi:hypothetical protein
MAAGDLISVQRAKLALPQLTDTSRDGTITLLITAATAAINRWCRRFFAANSYDELYDTDGTGSLLLLNYPVLAITRMAMDPVNVLTIQQTQGTSTLARATVATTRAPGADWPAASTGVILTRVVNGVSTVDATLLWATYPSIAQLAAAVNAVGNGWAATVQGSYGIWSSADINPIQGVYSAFNSGAQLTIHTTELTNYNLVAERGEVIFSDSLSNSGSTIGGWIGYSFGPQDLLPGLNVPRGLQNCRIQYVAGFNVVPGDVQQACALLVANMFAGQPGAVGELTAETLGDYSYTKDLHYQLPHHVRTLLAPYREHRA